MLSQRIVSLGLLACGGVMTAACGVQEPSHVAPVYDKLTGSLQLLKLDADRNGQVETWSYMDGTRILRIEIDQNEDGKIDRWEYYDTDQHINRIGTSQLDDGKADRWIHVTPDGSMVRLDMSGNRDGKITRSEYYDKDIVVSAEEDNDGDGRVDKWETYESGRLATVAFDTSHRGRPDRRLVYAPDGSARLEMANDAGQFVAVSAPSGSSPASR